MAEGELPLQRLGVGAELRVVVVTADQKQRRFGSGDLGGPTEKVESVGDSTRSVGPLVPEVEDTLVGRNGSRHPHRVVTRWERGERNTCGGAAERLVRRIGHESMQHRHPTMV